MLFASSFGKQPNTGSPAEAMGGFCLLTGFTAAVISTNHRASVWDTPRQGDVYSHAIDARGVSRLREGSNAWNRSGALTAASAPELALDTRILDRVSGYAVDVIEPMGGFAGYELAGFHNCTGRSRSKERPRLT